MSKGKAAIVGWKYSLGMHMILCHGPANEVQAISFGGRQAWSGARVGSGDISVNNPSLFGGDQREGGVVGTVHVAMGDASQDQNPYLVSQLGSNVPAYRGLVSMIFNKFNIGSNNPYVKSLAIRIKRTTAGWLGDVPWYTAKVDISGAMNAAHIVYQCLTDPEWGMGYPSTSVDDNQFKATADTLFTEGFGLCLMWNQQGKIEDFIGDVCNHIGAVLRTDPLTGKFQLKLIREDYTAGSLFLFDESNSKIEEYQRPNWGETTNEIVVGYTDMASGLKRVTAVQDLANIAVQGSVVSASREYPGIVSDAIAGRIAMRDLRAASTPLAKVQLIANRKGLNLNIGDVAKFSNANYGIVGMPLRILGISYGTLLDGTIKIDAVEDIYGMPTTSYVTPQGVSWVDPAIQPTPVVLSKLIEVPYWEVLRSSTTADFNTLDNLSAFVSAVADKPASGMFSFNLSINDGSGNYLLDDGSTFTPTCLLSAGIGYADVTLTYTSEVDLSSVVMNTYGYIDNECVVVTAINTITKVITIKRGMMDTVPEIHNSGARLWFSEEFTAFSQVERLSGDAVNVKLLTVSALGVLPAVSATNIGITMAGRFGSPYPPARVRINGLEYPDIISDTLVLTWAHRDRTTQTGPTLVDQYAGNIGPEPSTTYTVNYYRVTNGALLASASGLTGTTHTPTLPAGSYFIRIELRSWRAGYMSWQKHSIVALFVNTAQTRILENLNRRVLEDGVSVRVTQ